MEANRTNLDEAHGSVRLLAEAKLAEPLAAREEGLQHLFQLVRVRSDKGGRQIPNIQGINLNGLSIKRLVIL